MEPENIDKKLMSLLGNSLKESIGMRKVSAYLYERIVKDNRNNLNDLLEARMKKYYWSISLVKRFFYNVKKGYISKEMTARLVDVVFKGAFHCDSAENVKLHDDTVKAYFEKHGVNPPSFIVISPTQRCNLQCTGCYASSGANMTPQLSYSTVDKIIGEFRDEMGGRFVVVSGGEPLMYREGDKSLFDIFKKYNDVFFMFYTNGTLINEYTAHYLSKLGNAIPAISIEGYEKETDARRGLGTYSKIMQAMENLKNAGVPFLTSVTATSKNAELLLEDDFYEYYFDKMGASFMWQFQLMPIGRGKSAFEMVPTPEIRVKLYKKWESLLLKKKYPVADFWNSGVLVGGCIAYGRRGGYVYIDWNGNIMPCVFVPYTIDNVNEIYARGGSFGDALKKKFMCNGREWQDREQRCKSNMSNLLMPCSIRDHYDNFRKNILTSDVKGEDAPAQDILEDKEYHDLLCDYDEKLSVLTEKIWEEEYLKSE